MEKNSRNSARYAHLYNGDQAEDIFTTLKLTADETKDCEAVLKKFESHFIAKRNAIPERAKFNRRVQGESKPVDAFITDLYTLADHCQYQALHDELIRDKIVVGCRHSKLSKKLQMDPDLILTKAVQLARQSKTVKLQQNIVRNQFMS